jgi:hypothetical protein
VSVFWLLNFPVPSAAKVGKPSVDQFAAPAKVGISSGIRAANFIPGSLCHRVLPSLPAVYRAVLLLAKGGDKGLSDGGQKMN